MLLLVTYQVWCMAYCRGRAVHRSRPCNLPPSRTANEPGCIVRCDMWTHLPHCIVVLLEHPHTPAYTPSVTLAALARISTRGLHVYADVTCYIKPSGSRYSYTETPQSQRPQLPGSQKMPKVQWLRTAPLYHNFKNFQGQTPDPNNVPKLFTAPAAKSWVWQVSK